MNKKILWLLAIFLVSAVSIAEAQQQFKVFKIGWLGMCSPSSVSRYEEFRRALRDLGYVEGKNITFEYRSADNKLDRLPSLAEELVRLKADVIITRGTPEALALKNATNTIPIVFFDVTDPVGAGLVNSLARPGGNITGFSSIEALLAGKRLELLKEAVPKISRVAVLWNPHDPSSVQQWKESQLAARELGLQLHSMEVSGADQFENAFKAATQMRSSALFAVSNALAASDQTRLTELATRYRLPAIYGQASFATNGGLISYGPDQTERFRRAAVMVDKILKGAKPADLPVEQPTKFELVINLKTAKVLKLTI